MEPSPEEHMSGVVRRRRGFNLYPISPTIGAFDLYVNFTFYIIKKRWNQISGDEFLQGFIKFIVIFLKTAARMTDFVMDLWYHVYTWDKRNISFVIITMIL